MKLIRAVLEYPTLLKDFDILVAIEIHCLKKNGPHQSGVAPL